MEAMSQGEEKGMEIIIGWPDGENPEICNDSEIPKGAEVYVPKEELYNSLKRIRLRITHFQASNNVFRVLDEEMLRLNPNHEEWNSTRLRRKKARNLEQEIQAKDAEIERLRKETATYQSLCREYNSKRLETERENEAKSLRIKELEGALEFYANGSCYQEYGMGQEPEVLQDGGEYARQALNPKESEAGR